MSKHDDHVTMRQMLDHTREAITLARDKSRQDLDTNRMLNLALTRLLEIIGEAASRISSDYQEAHPSVPWQQIVGLRNRLIHGYDIVDFDILWDIIQHDLPSLVHAIEKILESNNP